MLDLDGATLTRSLHLEDCFFGDVVLCEDTQAIAIRLPGCHLPGISGPGLSTRGHLRLADGFTATGEVNLLGGRIGGNLDCDGATLRNPGGKALNADGVSVAGAVFLRDGFAATGEVNLVSARIGSSLECDGGTFTNPDGNALHADKVAVGGSLFCRNGFAATGEVNLVGGRVGSNLECDRGTFTSPDGRALNADSLTVEGSMFCRDGFAATGEVNLVGARIGGSLDCINGSFANPDGTALSIYRATVGSAVWFRPTSLAGGVQLSFARVGAWYDSARTWPRAGALTLNGFTYAAIDAHPAISVRQRLSWLRKDPEGFQPQPYEQLAGVYRGEGNDQHARRVQISAQWHRRIPVSTWTDVVLWPFRLIWSTLLALTIGYGYRPWQILVPIGALYTFGCWWFDRAADRHTIVPATRDLNPDVRFNAARYTADLLIPGASLGERAHFLATGTTAWWTTGYTLAGWALAAMLIAGLTGVFKRQ